MKAELKYSEIIKENQNLENMSSAQYKITILSNIMVHQTTDIFEYSLRRRGVNAKIHLGTYDNIVQDSSKCEDAHAVIIFWELYNLIDGLQYRLELLETEDYNRLIERVKLEIDLTLNNLVQVPLLIFNKFSTTVFDQHTLRPSRMTELAATLNEYVAKQNITQVTTVDIDRVIAKRSISSSIDMRYYYSSKTLYTIEFYKEYCEHINPIIMAANGKTKKALIFDCDNTLWHGVLGEDGFDGIEMIPEVQYLAKMLSKKGVIIGLCSKNNAEDVDEVLDRHEGFVLRDDDIVIKKANWTDKVTNLKAIANELNVGLDSLVFVDDSSFEVNLVREALPMIDVFQVPRKTHEYPAMMREICRLFYNPGETLEDMKKVEIYKAQAKRVAAEKESSDLEEYLKTLELKITVYLNDVGQIKRMSQMTQKTNQFNVTTKRYTENDISHFVSSQDKLIVAIGVSDRFGDNGVVGLVIVDLKGDGYAEIDSLLMSCRVLGRNVEYKLMDIIVDLLKTKRITTVTSSYIRTLKNRQVEHLFDQYGLEVTERNDTYALYKLNVNSYKYADADYIVCEHAS